MNFLNRTIDRLKASLFSESKSTQESPPKRKSEKDKKAGKNGRAAASTKASSGNGERKRPQSRSGEKRGDSERRQRPKKSWEPSQFIVAPAEGKKRFHDLNLPHSVMHAIADQKFEYCTPIQAEVLEDTLKGRDANGRAQTGTGKTAVFIITILSRLLRNRPEGKRGTGVPRALILAPTRELVIQIAKDARELSQYTPINIQTVFGGMDYKKQKDQLANKRADIIVATPGRLLDFCGQKLLNLRKVETIVIDEADRMLDMGFIPDVRKIIRMLPPKENRQTLMFSATLSDDVERLSYSWTKNPVIVNIEPEQVAADSVNQILYSVTVEDKFALLYNIITHQKLKRVLVFCNRRDETRRLAKKLERYGMSCKILSGEVPQRKRIKTLEDFKTGKVPVLIATDVAGRGIHIEDMDHVINYTLPHDPEDYVHRIGRTGRAGSTGTSISFACEEGAFQLPAIIELLGGDLPSIQPEDDWLKLPPAPRRLKTEESNDGETRRPRKDSKPRKPRQSGQSRSRNASRRKPSSAAPKPRPVETKTDAAPETPKAPTYGKRNQRKKINPR